MSPDAGSGTPGALMPLCSPSTPPSTTRVRICWRSLSDDPQLDAPVVEQEHVARLDERRQVFVARRDAPGPAEEVADGNHQLVAGGQRDRRVVAEQAGADLGAARGPAAARRCGRPRPPAHGCGPRPAPCASCEPCEKLRRKTSTPAAMRSRSGASLLVAGPTVAMIFVRRMRRLHCTAEPLATLDGLGP